MHGVIICGIEAVHHRLQQRLAGETRLRLEALVSDAPWQHGTRIAGVRVCYPGEVPALIERTGARALVYCRETDPAMFDGASMRLLKRSPVALLALDPDEEDDPADRLLRCLEHEFGHIDERAGGRRLRDQR
ncbi:hypothetical protein [Kushneria sinocarnis]|uniref:hypothetical protein n=1 Tax=Kushneria sinocarnis TaxID=595502 RepID=UPI0011C40DCC|nr:hypothetical protein [Kushneria sinocarnis]